MKRNIRLLVTDLDNTLYDWYASFVPAFYAMVKRASAILGCDANALLDELRLVHQEAGNSEEPYALLSTRIVNTVAAQRNKKARELLDPAFHEFNSVRKERLRLYPGVLTTLKGIHEAGVSTVAFTDARIGNSAYRIKALGLAGPISALYAPSHRHRNDPIDSYLPGVKIRYLPECDRKPNPSVLLDIIKDAGIDRGDVLYVGDSRSKDVAMAKNAGVTSALARYGAVDVNQYWESLVRVTHWTAEDVERERELRVTAAGIEPDFVLDSFDELLQYFSWNGYAVSREYDECFADLATKKTESS